MGSRFAKPIARIVFLATGLVALAIIGRTSIAGALGSPAAAAMMTVDASAEIASAVANPVVPAAPTSPAPAPSPHGQAAADNPVILNTADVSDLRRLPGIGEKRANAILALRSHLGRFRAVEDLLKVKGIGRATLKRLRPLLRIDAPSAPLIPDGGA
jgi:competence protein ComEA